MFGDLVQDLDKIGIGFFNTSRYGLIAFQKNSEGGNENSEVGIGKVENRKKHLKRICSGDV